MKIYTIRQGLSTDHENAKLDEFDLIEQIIGTEKLKQVLNLLDNPNEMMAYQLAKKLCKNAGVNIEFITQTKNQKLSTALAQNSTIAGVVIEPDETLPEKIAELNEELKNLSENDKIKAVFKKYAR